MLRTAVAGLAGLGLIGGVGSVAYNDNGSADVTIKNRKTGTAETVRLFGDRDGKSYSCPLETEDKLSPHDVRAGRIKLTLRQVRRQERRIDRRYPDHTAPAAVVDRFNGLLRRDDRLVSTYNAEVDARNAILEADCD